MAVFMLQYFSSPVFITVSILANKLDNCFVVHLLEPAVKQCFTGEIISTVCDLPYKKIEKWIWYKML